MKPVDLKASMSIDLIKEIIRKVLNLKLTSRTEKIPWRPPL